MSADSDDDDNTPDKRAVRVLDFEISDLEAKLERLRFVRRAILAPDYDDRYVGGKKP